MFWGPLDNPKNQVLADVNRRELLTLLPLIACMVWIGIAPGIFFDTIKEPVDYIVRQVDPTYFDKQPMQYTAETPQPQHVAEAR